MSFKKEVVSSLRWSIVDTIANKGLGFLIVLILTRLLTPEDFGLVGIILVITTICTAIMEGGLGVSLVRDTTANRIDYSTVFISNVVLAVVLYIAIFAMAPWIALYFEQPTITELLRVLGLNFMILSLGVVQQNLFMKEMNFKSLTMATVPATIIGGIVAVWAAFSGAGVWSLVYMPIVTQLVKTSMLWFLSNVRFPLSFSQTHFLKHFKFGYRLVVSSVLSTIFMELYALLIGKKFSVADLGYYNRARTFSLFPVGIIGTVINNVSYPMLSKIQNDKGLVAIQYKRIIQSAFFLLVGLMVILFNIADTLFLWLFTEKWVPFIFMFKILGISAVLVPIHEINLNVFKIFNKTDLLLKIELVKKLLIVGVFGVGYFFELEAMLVAMVISSYLALLINSYYAGRIINYPTKSQLLDMLPIVLIGLITGVAVYFFTFLITDFHIALQALLIFFISAFSYLSISFITRSSGLSEFYHLTKAILDRYKAK
ncbi:MAG: lipopolysaccharide biosynthesis protein [Cyclobacteriaceae bacterium]